MMATGRFSSGHPSLFDRFFNSDWMDNKDSDHSPANANLPMVNIMENADEYLVEVAAPGMRKSDFRVRYNDGKLTISSDRQEEVQDGVSYLRRE
jgi:HSP20 family protein